MSVEEIIERIEALDADQLLQVKHAVARVEAERSSVDEATQRRGMAAWDRLRHGWCSGGSRNAADTIDEALYGDEG